MNHPPCGCPSCSPKPPSACRCRPRKPEGVLLPRIVACDRRTIPCLDVSLCLSGLPACVQPPLTLVSLAQNGAQPEWTPVYDSCRGACLRVRIPVCAKVCDRCQGTYHGDGVIETEVSVRCDCLPADRQCLYLTACVCLLCAQPCSQDACFQAQVRVTLDVYLIQPEPCLLKRPEPECPDLPLYPPPITAHPPCCPQHPEAPGPCGWPARG